MIEIQTQIDQLKIADLNLDKLQEIVQNEPKTTLASGLHLEPFEGVYRLRVRIGHRLQTLAIITSKQAKKIISSGGKDQITQTSAGKKLYQKLPKLPGHQFSDIGYDEKSTKKILRSMALDRGLIVISDQSQSELDDFLEIYQHQLIKNDRSYSEQIGESDFLIYDPANNIPAKKILKASLTQPVIITIPANSIFSAVSRLENLGFEKLELYTHLRFLMVQRSFDRLKKDQGKEYTLNSAELIKIESYLDKINKSSQFRPIKTSFYSGRKSHETVVITKIMNSIDQIDNYLKNPLSFSESSPPLAYLALLKSHQKIISISDIFKKDLL